MTKSSLLFSATLATALMFLLSRWIPLVDDFYFEQRSSDFFTTLSPRSLIGSILNIFNLSDSAFTILKIFALWGWLILIINQFFRMYILGQEKIHFRHFFLVASLGFIFAFGTVSQMAFGQVRNLDSIPYLMILLSYLIIRNTSHRDHILSVLSVSCLLLLATLVHEKTIFDIAILAIWILWKDGFKKTCLYIGPGLAFSILFLFLSKSKVSTGLPPQEYFDILKNGLHFFFEYSFSIWGILLGGGALWFLYFYCSFHFIKLAPSKSQTLLRFTLITGMMICCIAPLLVAWDVNRLVGLLWLPCFLLLCELGPSIFIPATTIRIVGLLLLCGIQFAVPPMLFIPTGLIVFNQYANWVASPRAILPDPPLRKGDVMRFKDQATGSKFLQKGWHGPESWGVWSKERESTITIYGVDPEIRNLLVHLKTLIPLEEARQIIAIVINGHQASELELTNLQDQFFVVPIPIKLAPREDLNIQFQVKKPISPKDAQISVVDDRLLGVGLISIELQ